MVVVAIPAATAPPKFFSLSSRARIASLDGTCGSLATAAAMAHGKYLPVNPPSSTVRAEGAIITFATVVASGYPNADAGLAATAGLNASHHTMVAASSSATANSPATSATEVAFIPVGIAGAPAGLSCFVKYAEPVTARSAPTIGPTTTGC
jgi:MSHA pilin protein MshA